MHLWIPSSLTMSSMDCRAQIWVVYPKCGLTRARYSVCLTSVLSMNLVFLFKYASSLLAHKDCSLTCLYHVRSLLIHIPRPFLSFAVKCNWHPFLSIYQCPLCFVAVRLSNTLLKQFFSSFVTINYGNFFHLESRIVKAWLEAHIDCVLQLPMYLHKCTDQSLQFLLQVCLSFSIKCFKKRND